jgi:hypothetical protein
MLHLQVLHSRVGSWPYPQAKYYSGTTCQGQTISFLQTFVKYSPKKFYNIGPSWLQTKLSVYCTLPSG